MAGGRAQTIEPGAAIFGARRGEGGARKLFRKEAERRLVGGVLAKGERPGHRFGGEVIGKAGEIIGHSISSPDRERDQPQAGGGDRSPSPPPLFERSPSPSKLREETVIRR